MRKMALLTGVSVVLAVMVVALFVGKMRGDRNPVSLRRGAVQPAKRGDAANLLARVSLAVETQKADGNASPEPTSRPVGGAMSVDPALRSAQRWIEMHYGDALRALHLSPKAYDKVRELLIERRRTDIDAHAVVDENNIRTSDQRMAVIREAEAVIDREIREVAGDEAFRQLQTMLSASTFHDQVRTEYSVDMQFAGCPLTPEQAAKLGTLLYETYGIHNPQDEALRLQPAEPSNPLSTLDTEALQKARAFLSEEQLKVLQEDLALSTSTLRRSWPAK